MTLVGKGTGPQNTATTTAVPKVEYVPTTIPAAQSPVLSAPHQPQRSTPTPSMGIANDPNIGKSQDSPAAVPDGGASTGAQPASRGQETGGGQAPNNLKDGSEGVWERAKKSFGKHPFLWVGGACLAGMAIAGGAAALPIIAGAVVVGAMAYGAYKAGKYLWNKAFGKTKEEKDLQSNEQAQEKKIDPPLKEKLQNRAKEVVNSIEKHPGWFALSPYGAYKIGQFVLGSSYDITKAGALGLANGVKNLSVAAYNGINNIGSNGKDLEREPLIPPSQPEPLTRRPSISAPISAAVPIDALQNQSHLLKPPAPSRPAQSKATTPTVPSH